MWQSIRVGHDVGLAEFDKWIKVNDTNGRILGRVHLKEGEYKASKLIFDGEGVGNKNYLGSFATLVQAQAAVDAE